MSDSASLDSFIDKWQRRWPEWDVLSGFLPAAQRPVFRAWMALLQEFGDAAWGGSDPAPGLAKLAWWQEELRGWSRGGRRHPLGEVLQKQEAPWERLAAALPALPRTRAAMPVQDDAAALSPFAEAVQACDAALFGTGAGAAPATTTAALIAMLRGERALVQGDRDAAGTLLSEWPAGGLSRRWRLHAVALRRRLRGFASARAPGRGQGFALLFAGWRAARGD